MLLSLNVIIYLSMLKNELIVYIRGYWKLNCKMRLLNNKSGFFK